MKVKITALEVRYLHSIIKVIPLRDIYTNVCLSYQTNLFTLDELRDALKGWCENTRRHCLGQYADGCMLITLEAEAKDLPSIGDVKVSIVEKDVEWRAD